MCIGLAIVCLKFIFYLRYVFLPDAAQVRQDDNPLTVMRFCLSGPDLAPTCDVSHFLPSYSSVFNRSARVSHPETAWPFSPPRVSCAAHSDFSLPPTPTALFGIRHHPYSGGGLRVPSIAINPFWMFHPSLYYMFLFVIAFILIELWTYFQSAVLG